MQPIKVQYPDQWVLVGNPELRNPETNGSFFNCLMTGVILLANIDKRELAYQSKPLTGLHSETICSYTAEVATNRIFLL